MRKKILPIMLAFAFLFSALVIVADDSDADTSDKLVINGVAIPAGTSYEDPAGRWSYDSFSNILSLNNAVLTELYDDETENISSIIYNAYDDGDSFRIMLNGDSYIQECSSPRQDYKGCGIFCKQHLDIIGEGTLTINTPSYEHGILVNKILYITADAHVEAYSSGASYRVEGIQACFHIEGATVVSEKQVEVLGGFTEGRGMLIDDGGSLTFSTYMGFLDLGNSVQYDNGRLRIKAGGSLNRIEGTSGEQSYPLVRCWNNGGGSRIEINGSMYNAVHDPTVHQNREYVTVPNPEDPSYIGEFKSKVTFDANGGTCSTTSEFTQNTGKLDSLPSPDARDGFNYEGWFTEPRLDSGEQITTDTIFPYDATVYAQWRAIHRTVIFDANGGTCGTP
ncbi:MAG: InlB B-repeat-containing protein, partial [Candidatus Methanomethylophilaceae archaeon]|nr:InlB B-repeat-containing protein [Candidatus Methanomethylophilaceae archaeon]